MKHNRLSHNATRSDERSATHGLTILLRNRSCIGYIQRAAAPVNTATTADRVLRKKIFIGNTQANSTAGRRQLVDARKGHLIRRYARQSRKIDARIIHCREAGDRHGRCDDRGALAARGLGATRETPAISVSGLEATGTLKVLLKEGVGLKAADMNGKSDPYVIAKCGGQEKKSKVIQRSLNPKWNQTLDFAGKLSDFLESDLVLNVFDKDWVTKDDPLGDATVSLEELRTKVLIETEAELSIKVSRRRHASKVR